MLNCKDATRLISEGLDHRLSMWQRMNLRLHVMMCGACGAYKRQVEGLHRLFSLRRHSSTRTMPTDPAASLSPERRAHIKHLLEAEFSSHAP